jgi:hypothetical protein
LVSSDSVSRISPDIVPPTGPFAVQATARCNAYCPFGSPVRAKLLCTTNTLLFTFPQNGLPSS